MNSDSATEEAYRPLRTRLEAGTRAADFQVSRALIAQRALHAAKMEEIAAHAGVEVDTLYNSFDSRLHRLGALLDARRAQFEADLEQILTGKAPFRHGLEAFLQVAVRHLDERWRVFAGLMGDELAYRCGGSGDSRHRPMLYRTRELPRLFVEGARAHA